MLDCFTACWTDETRTAACLEIGPSAQRFMRSVVSICTATLASSSFGITPVGWTAATARCSLSKRRTVGGSRISSRWRTKTYAFPFLPFPFGGFLAGGRGSRPRPSLDRSLAVRDGHRPVVSEEINLAPPCYWLWMQTFRLPFSFGLGLDEDRARGHIIAKLGPRSYDRSFVPTDTFLI